MDTLEYSVVIPVFNESANLKELYLRLKSVMDSLSSAYEIIFIDDGSNDDSYEVLKNIALSDVRVRVLRFAKNCGQHKAVVCGLENARGTYVITMDADLQNPPEEIRKLLEKIKEGFDMVSGFRRYRKDNFKRRICSWLANYLMGLITGLKMKDYGSMLRVFRQKTAKDLSHLFLETNGYITMLVARVTRKVAEIEVAHEERYRGESKYGIRQLFSVFSRAIFCYHRRRKPASAPFVISQRIEEAREYCA